MAVTIEIARRDKQMSRLGWARFLLSSSEFVKMEEYIEYPMECGGIQMILLIDYQTFS
jgi:hypothetical protein